MNGGARYRAILGAPHVASLVLASVLARLPMGIGSLAMVLFVSGERGSFGVAGVVSGAFGLGAAVGMPLQSRLIDRRGQRTVLLAAVGCNVGALAAVIALTTGGAPRALLPVTALVAGGAPPAPTPPP